MVEGRLLLLLFLLLLSFFRSSTLKLTAGEDHFGTVCREYLDAHSSGFFFSFFAHGAKSLCWLFTSSAVRPPLTNRMSDEAMLIRFLPSEASQR